MASRAKNKPPHRQNGRNKERSGERLFLLVMRAFDLIEKLGPTILICATVVAFAYYGIYKPVEVSAGKTTIINHFWSMMGNLDVNVAIAWGAATGFGLLAHSQRKKRLRERKEKDTRIAELEQIIDPNRSSSNLTVDGEESL